MNKGLFAKTGPCFLYLQSRHHTTMTITENTQVTGPQVTFKHYLSRCSKLV